jgi:hypothetical protein
MFSTIFNQETADLVAKYAIEGKLKAAVSETLEMKDALKVCGRTLLLEDADGVSIRATISS